MASSQSIPLAMFYSLFFAIKMLVWDSRQIHWMTREIPHWISLEKRYRTHRFAIRAISFFSWNSMWNSTRHPMNLPIVYFKIVIVQSHNFDFHCSYCYDMHYLHCNQFIRFYYIISIISVIIVINTNYIRISRALLNAHLLLYYNITFFSYIGIIPEYFGILVNFRILAETC